MLFWKMQGAGNDFIVFDNIMRQYHNYTNLAYKLCDRHFGIGADGMMAVESSSDCEVKMIYYNQDGSQGEMCGNGIRCFAKFVYENRIVDKKKFMIETKADNYEVELDLDGEEVSVIRVFMGKPMLACKNIPVNTPKDIFLNEKLLVEDKEFNSSAVLIGVPHLVILADQITDSELNHYGSLIESNVDLFSKKINVNFVNIIDEETINVKTYERGCGYTLACGTGMTSSAYITNKLNKTQNRVKVISEGGEVIIDMQDNGLYMTGPAVKICEGRVDDKWLLA